MNTATATKSLTAKQAYDKGWASSQSQVDWDEALVRFTRKYCPHATYGAMCPLCRAWADGWTDRVVGQKKGHALRCQVPADQKPHNDPDDHEGEACYEAEGIA